MRKLVSLLLATIMISTFAACGDEKSNEASEAETTTVADVEETDAPAEETEAPAADTLGQALLADFKARDAEDPSASAQTIADGLITNPLIQFDGATMPVENGLLTGFGNAEITGFSEGVMFAPMISSIAFVGYVFTLEDGADADAFIKTLTDNADPRWNICTEADETVTGASGNKVFFVMCSNSAE